MAFVTITAIGTAAVAGAIGINTHLDFQESAYRNIAATERAIKYLGVRKLRDSAQVATDPAIWLEVANATGAKFDDYMPEGSKEADTSALTLVPALAATGILNAVEGGNENDDPYAVSQGNSIAWTAAFQRKVYSVGHALGLPVINMSFGSGWTWTNDWHGDYDKTGDLSRYCDFGNAHTYPNVGSTAVSTIKMLTGNAKLAAVSRPIATTELGWNGKKFSPRDVARYALDGVFDAMASGNAAVYFYALFDDQSGAWGLMNANGAPRPAGMAIHNLIKILGGPALTQPRTLTYQLTSRTTNDQTLLMQKRQRVFDLAVWNEFDPPHAATFSLPAAAKSISVYDPLSRTAAVKTVSTAKNLTFVVPDHPVIVEIVQ